LYHIKDYRMIREGLLYGRRKMKKMSSFEPVLVVDLFPLERQALLQLLVELSEEDWLQTTICAGWSVKDVVLHVLGDDIGLLSRQRDAYDQFKGSRDQPEFATWDELVAFINENNALWVKAMRRMSNSLACTFLKLTGEEFYEYMKSLDPFALGGSVGWAGPDPAPVWLDIAREYTERWLHQQHIRDAVGRPGFKERLVFAPVLATFVWALPQAFRNVQAIEGTLIHLRITGEAGGEWSLKRELGSWVLGRANSSPADTLVVLDQETAWRLFTKGISKDEALRNWTFQGDELLARKVLDTVSIIA
jgi:uncharacterized protein (TIGR03083 family)